MAAGVRRHHQVPAAAGRRGGGRRRDRAGVGRGDVPAVRRRTGPDRRPRSGQLPVPVDVHPGRRAAGGRGGGVRVATVAVAARAPGTPGPRPGRRRRPRPAGLHRWGCGAHRGLRLPVAAPLGLPAGARDGDGGRPSGGARDAVRARVAAARGRRPAQLRPLPVDLADLRVRRGDARFGRPVPRRDGGRDRVLRAVLPLRRDAGAQGRAHPVVAHRRSCPRQGARRDGHGRGPTRRLLRGGRSIRPGRGRGGRGLRGACRVGADRSLGRSVGFARAPAPGRDRGGLAGPFARRQPARGDRKHVRGLRRFARRLQRVRLGERAQLASRVRQLVRDVCRVAGRVGGRGP